MTREEGVQRENNSTRNWAIGIIISIMLQAGAIVYWVAGVEAQVEDNERDIAVLQEEINDIETDIRAILIGIEQVKARLGIVENDGR